MFSWLRRGPDRAQEALQSAVNADREGRSEAAVELYTKGIAELMQSLKQTTDEQVHKQMRAKINEYMTRAEFLKEQIRERAATASATRSARVLSAPADASSVASPLQTVASTSTTRAPPSTSTMSGFIKTHSQLAHTILDEILDQSPGVNWDDIAGLDVAKQLLKEAAIFPMLRPDLFTGLREPPKGVLLFGPPGTGKTLLAKAIATESNATFFNISASSLTSKWVGEGEKLVRVLFAMARELQPSVIFVDEMDALLGGRSASEHDASRRMKNQFFTEIDGAATSKDAQILVMGATNLPQELDEAIIRRLEKRIFVPLPDPASREYLIRHLLRQNKYSLSQRQLQHIVTATEGYSGSDLKALCKDAALGPLRSIGACISDIKSEDVRGINVDDFGVALQRVRPSVSQETIDALTRWNAQYGVSAVL